MATTVYEREIGLAAILKTELAQGITEIAQGTGFRFSHRVTGKLKEIDI